MSISSSTSSNLSKQFWDVGYIHLRNFFTPLEKSLIQECVSHLYALPETPYKWMKYYESGKDHQLSRVENFYSYTPPEFSDLIEKKVQPVVEEIAQKEQYLFKDKLNWKLPGGGAFQPHQDHPAWKEFTPLTYLTAMLFIDPMTALNGCLQVSTGMDRNRVEYNLNPDGSLPTSVTDGLTWKPVIGTQNDLLIFDSYIPHRSGPNNTNVARRAMFLTYNDAVYGNLYKSYFQKKRKHFPPLIEREEGKVYESSIYNLANPIK